MNEDPVVEDAPRRLIVLAWAAGMSLEIDYEGDFATWEVLAALEEAARIIRSEKQIDDLEEGEDG